MPKTNTHYIQPHRSPNVQIQSTKTPDRVQTIQINDLEFRQSPWLHGYPTNTERMYATVVSEDRDRIHDTKSPPPNGIKVFAMMTIMTE